MTTCGECGYSLTEHVGQSPCLPATPPRKARGLYDLPIFGWAWTGDAKRTERES